MNSIYSKIKNMANYTPTANPDLVNMEYVISGMTTIDIQGYVNRYLEIKGRYQTNLAQTKQEATLLYEELKPIFDAGLLPAKYNAGFAELEAFIS